MNAMYKLKNQLARRHGLSVIEVLSSMVVALIGVAGVLVLIPFAVKQGQLGLDLDRANSLARNGIAMFELGEHDRLVNGDPVWIEDTAGTQVTAVESFAIDPLRITATGVFDQFPSSQSIAASPAGAGIPLIADVNLSTLDATTGALNPYSEASAHRMFYNHDSLIVNSEKDVVTNVELADLAPPQQVYDFSAGGNLRRQFNPDLSWLSIVVPKKDDLFSAAPTASTNEWKYEQHMLVFRDRVLDPTLAVMPIATLGGITASATNQTLRPGATILINGTADDIRKNDWIMLVNENPNLEAGYQKQVGFFRVIGMGAYNGTTTQTPITLDGPEFNLWNAEATIPTTYAVHLVQYDAVKFAAGELDRRGNVLNVYQRTMRLKEKSSWNK